MNSLKLFLILFYLISYRNVLTVDYYENFGSNETSDRSAQNCGFDARQKCLEPIKYYLSVKHVSYGKNENQLSETCR